MDASPPPTIKESFGASCVTGRRFSNEDAHIVEPGIAAIAAAASATSLLAVFDGHGGAMAAELARDGLVKHLRAQAGFEAAAAGGSAPQLADALRLAFSSLDADILKKQAERPRVAHMPRSDESGCTAVVVLTTPTHLICANAGDSRACYVGPAGVVRALSEDHKPSNVGERARIEAAGGTVSTNGRISGGLAVSRSMGDPHYKDRVDLPPEEQRVVAVPDVQVVARRPAEDEVVVVACDGIWDVFTNQEVGALLWEGLELLVQCREEKQEKGVAVGRKHSRHSGGREAQWAQLLCNDLIDIAFARGSTDNMTAVIRVSLTATRNAGPKAQVGSGDGQPAAVEAEAKRQE